jgi:hypothetical protein
VLRLRSARQTEKCLFEKINKEMFFRELYFLSPFDSAQDDKGEGVAQDDKWEVVAQDDNGDNT